MCKVCSRVWGGNCSSTQSYGKRVHDAPTSVIWGQYCPKLHRLGDRHSAILLASATQSTACACSTANTCLARFSIHWFGLLSTRRGLARLADRLRTSSCLRRSYCDGLGSALASDAAEHVGNPPSLGI